MHVSVNGTTREVRDGIVVADLVAAGGVAPGEPGVAVALDGEVVARRDWGATPVPAGARVEIVRAAAGG